MKTVLLLLCTQAMVLGAVLSSAVGCRKDEHSGESPVAPPPGSKPTPKVALQYSPDSWICGTRTIAPIIRTKTQLDKLASKMQVEGSPLSGLSEEKFSGIVFQTQQSIALDRLHKLGQAHEVRIWILKHDDRKDALLFKWLQGWKDTNMFTFKLVDGPPAEIRVRYELYHWESLIGSEGGLTGTTATMFLGIDPSFTATSEEAQRTALLHEFGHALGMYHELSTPGSVLKLDKDKLEAYFGQPPFNQPPEWVKKNILDPLSGNVSTYAFDRKSIMIYPLPPELTTDGQPVLPPGGISPNDVSSLKKAYNL